MLSEDQYFGKGNDNSEQYSNVEKVYLFNRENFPHTLCIDHKYTLLVN